MTPKRLKHLQALLQEARTTRRVTPLDEAMVVVAEALDGSPSDTAVTETAPQLQAVFAEFEQPSSPGFPKRVASLLRQ